MKPVIPLTRGHVVGLVKYVAEQLGKGSDTKLPRGLVDSCIRAGSAAAECAIEAAVNEALAPKSPGYYVPKELIPQPVSVPTVDLVALATFTGDPQPIAAPPTAVEPKPEDEPLFPGEAVAILENLKTPTAQVCPIVAKAVEMADAAIAPLLESGFEDVSAFDGEAPAFENEDDDGDDVPLNDDDDTPLASEEAQTLPAEPRMLTIDEFIAKHNLNLISPGSPTGEWFCCRGDLGKSVLESKPAAEAAIRQGIIVPGETKKHATESYASLNGLSFAA